MIVEIILIILSLLLGLINFLLPAWQLPQELFANTQAIWSVASGLNSVLPLTELLLCLIIVLTFEIIMLIYRFFRSGGKI